MKTAGLLLVLSVGQGSFSRVSAVAVPDYAVRVSATVQSSPPLISLSWVADQAATNYVLFRKGRADTSWGSALTLPSNATNYVDSNIVAGMAYEYRISKTAPTYLGAGYIYAGAELPLVESRGRLLLFVDSTWASALGVELLELHQDLVGDGWVVSRHDVDRGESATNIKAMIVSEYNSDPINTTAVFLFGHVPVPYSGNLAPDGHGDHQGAWPADLYYGDVDGVWTDSTVNTTYAASSRNWNLPGDGKFDQNSLPSNVDLQVGRVDFSNLPSFGLSEPELLRRYLNKDHRFRHKLFDLERRGWIDDNFGDSNGEVPAATAWRNFAALFGASNTVAGSDWFSTLANQSYLWSFGCGSGNFTGASGIGTTTDFANNDPKTVFTMLFGSWFGDWDSQDNFLRAAIATPSYTLASTWGSRPNWIVHHMALGETIGFSTRLTQNNPAIYEANGYWRYVHVALMGDPTLRMHIVVPPTNLVAVANGVGGVDLSWDASPDTVLGYHVYRATSAAGPFTRLNTTLISGNNFTDSSPAGTYYMVRAVKLEVSGSGSYYNASQGIFQVYSGAPGPPVLNIENLANAVALSWPTNSLGYQLEATTSFSPANWLSVTNVVQITNGLNTVVFSLNGSNQFFRLRQP